MGLLSLIAELGININPYVQGLFRARGEASKFGRDVGSQLKNSLAGAFGAAAVLGFARKTIEFGGQISDLAARLDTSTDSLQEWNYAATQNGAAAQDVTAFFERLAGAKQEALKGDKEALGLFQEFGVAVKDLENLRTDQLGKRIADAVKAGDIQQLSGSLRELGGKSSTKLATAFKAGIGEAAAEARELGQVLDEEVIMKMDQLGDRQAQVMTTLMGPMATFLGWLNTALTKITQTFQLLGAFSTKISAKDLFTPGALAAKFGAFANSAEAQAIVAESDGPQKGTAPGDKFRDLSKAKKATEANKSLKSEALGRLSTDSLASIGGFVGRASSAGNQMLTVAQKSLKEQEKIAENTKPGTKKEQFSRR